MPPTLILIRHGEAQHNATTRDYNIRDPLLTQLGHQQCSELNAHLMHKEPLMPQIETVVCSPMKRTVQTMCEGLECVLNADGGKRVKVEFDAGWQENSDAPCDTGSSISTLQGLFPQYKDDLTKVDRAWPSKTGAYAFTRSANKARGQSVLRALRDRPEKVIAVVSHAGFLRTAISQCHYSNADYRVFSFAEPKHQNGDSKVKNGDEEAEGEIRLREWERTEQDGGAMGNSWKGLASVEESDFPDEDKDDGSDDEETPPPTPLECLGGRGKI